MDFEALYSANFALLDDTVTDWSNMLTKLGELEKDAKEGLHDKAAKADWAGYNATVSREFIGRTAGEFADARTQATSIRNIMSDVRDELKTQQRLLREAVERGRQNGLTVTARGGGFLVSEKPGSGESGGSGRQKELDALRDEIEGILDRAADLDSTAATSLKALVDLTNTGFSGVSYKDRDTAALALKEAERLSSLARKKPGDLTAEEFDELNAGLKKYSGDELFAERFAERLGAKGTLEFWAGINDFDNTRRLGPERVGQYDDLQKHLGLTLATATQADTLEMAKWKHEMTELGSQPVTKNGTTMGFQVMSNLMRWGNYEDQFLRDYGTELIRTEKELSRNGRHAPLGWQLMGMDPTLNRTGSDSGADPMTGFLRALSNSPDAAIDFFNGTFLTKDEDHEFERDTDGNGQKGKIGLSNFQYLFEERHWPQEVDSKGKDSIEGRNNLAMALEAAATGHPAGEMPTADTPAHTAAQAKLVESIFVSVSEVPERLTDRGYMADSLGQIAAEYMPDIHRGLHPGKESEEGLFPVAGSAATLKEHDITRFLYLAGQNPDGYAAINVGQHSYTASLMEYHFAKPEAYLSDDNYRVNENLRKGIESIAKVAGEIEGTIGAGRAYANEIEGGTKDKEFNDALESAGAWIGSGVGIGVGIAVAPTAGPGAVAAGGLAETAAGEIISTVTEGLMKDSADEVIYRNGQTLSETRESTYLLVEEAARKAGEKSGNPSPNIVATAATGAEQGFNNAHSNIRDSLQGEGIPKKLETKD